MTTAQRLWLGFGTLFGLLLLLGATVSQLVHRQERDLDRIVASREPIAAAVRTMEIEIDSVGISALLYLELPESERRTRVSAAKLSFAQARSTYTSLIRLPDERRFSDELGALFPPYVALCERLMDRADELELASGDVAEGFARCETALANVAPTNRARALAKVRLDLAEVGTWLGHYRNTRNPEHKARLSAAAWTAGGALDELARTGSPELAAAVRDPCRETLLRVASLVDVYEVQSADLRTFSNQRDQFNALFQTVVPTSAQGELEAAKAAAKATARRVELVLAGLLLVSLLVGLLPAVRVSRSVLAVESALHERGEWLRVTLASIGDGVITTDVDGKLTYLNAVAERLTGWSSSEAMGKPLTEVFRVTREPAAGEAGGPVAQVLSADEAVGIGLPATLQDRHGGEVPITESAAPIRDELGQVSGVVLVFHDDSQRRQTDEALRLADQRKDEFLATLAHELRNPLAPLRNAHELLRQQPAGAAIAEPVAMIGRQLENLVRLVDDLLDVSRITRGLIELRRQPFLLHQLVELAVETSQPLIASHGHTLTVTLPEQPVELTGDLTRLAQALSNVLNNAAKYTEPGGSISLSGQLVSDQVASTAVIKVQDSGVGMPPELISRVFDMFVQGGRAKDNGQEGLGIGLALSRRLVEMHGGTLQATSAGIGHGSELTLSVPAIGYAAAPVPAKVPAAALVAPRSLDILAVDDNRDAVTSLAILLRLQGHRVAVAYDGPSALTTALASAPQVVLLDIGLPGLDGYEVARQLRARPEMAATTLIALTGWGQEEDRQRSWAAGFDHHLVKPVAPEALAKLLGELAVRT